jgi:hypothetical protein
LVFIIKWNDTRINESEGANAASLGRKIKIKIIKHDDKAHYEVS